VEASWSWWIEAPPRASRGRRRDPRNGDPPLQNPHPLFVHFPIAFLAAAVVAEWAYVVWRRPLLETLARWFLYLGTLAAAAAVFSGWLGSLSVAPVSAAREPLETHRTLAFLTLGTAVVLTFWRWGTARRGGPKPRLLFALGVLGLGVLLVAAANEGGELVHEHGVGTALTAPGGPLAEPADSSRPAASTKDVPKSTDFR